MSFFESFLGGAAQAGTGILQDQMKEEQVQRMAKFQEELAMERQRTINAWQQENKIAEEDRAISNSNKLREQQVSRIDGAAKTMAGKYADETAIPKKRGEVESGIADRGNWTPDQQAAVDQSLQGDRESIVQGMSADPRIRTKAAISTGDIDPKTAATLTSSADIQQMRSDAALKEIERKIETAKDKNETAMAIAELKAHLSGGGKAPSGYRFNSDGSLSSIPGGPADKNASDKALPSGVLKQLQEVRDNATTITNLSDSFKDDFASKGVLGMGAEGSMSAKAVLGTDKEAVDWWKNYRKQAELVERHAMFGASLTPGEQGSWRSADIGPGMDKDVIKKNLATRAALTQRMLENTRQDFIDAGHSENRINSIASRGPNKEDGAKPSQKVAPQNVSSIEAELRRRGLIP